MFFVFRFNLLELIIIQILSAFLGRPAYAILNRLRIYCAIFCLILYFPSLHGGTYLKGKIVFCTLEYVFIEL